MSPLACSLFALAALLATAHGHCTTKHLGKVNLMQFVFLDCILDALQKCGSPTNTRNAFFFIVFEIQGRRTNTQIPSDPVDFQPPGALIDDSAGKCPPGMHVVGEDIVACNYDPDGPAPDIEGPPPGRSSPIYVFCVEYDCPYGGYTQVTLYCDY